MSESTQHGADGGKIWKYPTDTSFVPKTKLGNTRRIKNLSTVEIIGFIVNFILILAAFLGFAMTLHMSTLFIFSFMASSIATAFLVCKYAGIERHDTFRWKSVYVGSIVSGLISLMIVIAGSAIVLTATSMFEENSAPSNTHQEEYSEIDPSILNFSGEVVDDEGNEITVGVYPYKGQNIIFKTPEQLSEKIAEVDAGTFEVEK